jgi:hypothetical protein
VLPANFQRSSALWLYHVALYRILFAFVKRKTPASRLGDLGFVVMRIQEQFPDCEAMRKIDDQHWQLVKDRV